MLLIWSSAGDTTVDWFISTYLNGSNVRWIRFNTEDFPEKGNITATPETCRLFQEKQIIEPETVTGVWYRRPVPSIFTTTKLPDGALDFVRDASDHALATFRGFLKDLCWVNWPEYNAEASQKLAQLQTAKRHNFRVPETIITNDSNAVLDLAERHNGMVIAKPLHKGTVTHRDTTRIFYTTLLSREQIKSLDASIRVCPLIFQEPIEKDFELRVIVVQDRCFAVKLHSQERIGTKVDWRKDPYGMKHTAFTLPKGIAERCVRIVEQSRLLFTAFDLVATPAGEYVFLEHNPNGQFAWLEEKTGVPIGKALLDLFRGVQSR